jgi:hypothetical protein
MNLLELIRLYREQTQDFGGDTLDQDDWIDDTNLRPVWVTNTDATRLANRAQKEACRRAHLIWGDSDSDPDVCLVPVTAGIASYTLSPLIRSIEEVVLESTARRLRKTTLGNVRHHYTDWRSESDTPHRFLQKGLKIRLVPNPIIDDNLMLSVWRMPATDMQWLGTATTDEPEIPAEYHEDLAHWMCFETFSRQNSELFDPKKAANHYALFEARFGRLDAADVREHMKSEPDTLTLTTGRAYRDMGRRHYGRHSEEW